MGWSTWQVGAARQACSGVCCLSCFHQRTAGAAGVHGLLAPLLAHRDGAARLSGTAASASPTVPACHRPARSCPRRRRRPDGAAGPQSPGLPQPDQQAGREPAGARAPAASHRALAARLRPADRWAGFRPTSTACPACGRGAEAALHACSAGMQRILTCQCLTSLGVYLLVGGVPPRLCSMPAPSPRTDRPFTHRCPCQCLHTPATCGGAACKPSQAKPSPASRAARPPADGALGFATALASLQQLDLSGCRELGPASLAPLAALAPSLACLRLQHCSSLRGPAALAPLSALTGLAHLNLGGCTGIHGQALRALRCGAAPAGGGCAWGRRVARHSQMRCQTLRLPPQPPLSYPPTHIHSPTNPSLPSPPRLALPPCSTMGGLRSLCLEGCRGVPLLDAGLAALAPHLGRLTSLNLQARQGSGRGGQGGRGGRACAPV